MHHSETSGTKVGEVFTFFSKVSVAGIKLTGTLSVGDRIRIRGEKTDFEQKVDSMQIERNPVTSANSGTSVGIKVSGNVNSGDIIYKV